MLENEAGDHGVEHLVRKRQLVGGGASEVGATALDSDADLVPRRVSPDDKLDTVEPRRQAAQLTLSASHVEDAGRPSELGSGQRQDLFVVLRVGATSESVDPPLGVPLPEVGVARGARRWRRRRSPAHVTERHR